MNQTVKEFEELKGILDSMNVTSKLLGKNMYFKSNDDCLTFCYLSFECGDTLIDIELEKQSSIVHLLITTHIDDGDEKYATESNLTNCYHGEKKLYLKKLLEAL